MRNNTNHGMIDVPSTSWPGLSRPTMSLIRLATQNVDARDKRGHDESNIITVGINLRSLTSAKVTGSKFDIRRPAPSCDTRDLNGSNFLRWRTQPYACARSAIRARPCVSSRYDSIGFSTGPPLSAHSLKAPRL